MRHVRLLRGGGGGVGWGGGSVWEAEKARRSAFWVMIVPLIIELLLIHIYIFE